MGKSFFVPFLDNPSASFGVVGALLILVVLALLVRSRFRAGDPYLLLGPLLLWFVNGFWVGTKVFKWYSFKIDLYLLYPALSLLTLGCIVLYVVSLARESFLIIESREISTEPETLVGKLSSILNPILDLNYIRENQYVIGGCLAAFLLLMVVVGAIQGGIFLALLGGIFILIGAAAFGVWIKKAATESADEKKRLTDLEEKFANLSKVRQELKTSIDKFEKHLDEFMLILPKEAGESYQKAMTFYRAFHERLTTVEQLKDKKKAAEIEAALLLLNEPLVMIIDVVNTLTSIKIPRQLPNSEWQNFSEDCQKELCSFLRR